MTEEELLDMFDEATKNTFEHLDEHTDYSYIDVKTLLQPMTL